MCVYVTSAPTRPQLNDGEMATRAHYTKPAHLISNVDFSCIPPTLNHFNMMELQHATHHLRKRNKRHKSRRKSKLHIIVFFIKIDRNPFEFSGKSVKWLHIYCFVHLVYNLLETERQLITNSKIELHMWLSVFDRYSKMYSF